MVDIVIDVKDYPSFDPAHGRFNMTVATIENHSDGTELQYSLRPRTVETYVVKVVKGFTGPARISLWRKPASGGNLLFVMEKVLKKCHNRQPGTQFKPDVDFFEFQPQKTECMATGAVQPPAYYASMLPFDRIVAFLTQSSSDLTGPIWIDCGPGCCS